MIGQCCEALERPDDGCGAYLASLDLDPLAISAAERLKEIAVACGRHDLSLRVRSRLARLASLAGTERGIGDTLKPYQQDDGVLGR